VPGSGSSLRYQQESMIVAARIDTIANDVAVGTPLQSGIPLAILWESPDLRGSAGVFATVRARQKR